MPRLVSGLPQPLFGRLYLYCILLGIVGFAKAQLPAPTYGWNLGNTLEAPHGEGSWGPVATKNLIDSVAATGFNTIRIPCAWDNHADKVTHEIDPLWMKRVKEVVDWSLAKNLCVVLNCHWDSGWFETKISDKVDPEINSKLDAYWRQIAIAFKDYDSRLVFAGANEPHAETPEAVATLVAYYQTFINTVRSTGGNNTERWLVIQGPNADIEITDRLLNTLPADSTPGRLAVEIHYYTPYQFCLMEKDASWGKMFYFWGAGNHHESRGERNSSWGEESQMAALFEKMAAKFVRHGVPVVLGEFQAMKRSGLSDLKGADFQLHLASRNRFHHCVMTTAIEKGLSPIYWDIPQMMFDWNTGEVLDAENLKALTGGSNLPPSKSPVAAVP